MTTDISIFDPVSLAFVPLSDEGGHEDSGQIGDDLENEDELDEDEKGDEGHSGGDESDEEEEGEVM